MPGGRAVAISSHESTFCCNVLASKYQRWARHLVFGLLYFFVHGQIGASPETRGMMSSRGCIPLQRKECRCLAWSCCERHTVTHKLRSQTPQPEQNKTCFHSTVEQQAEDAREVRRGSFHRCACLGSKHPSPPPTISVLI